MREKVLLIGEPNVSKTFSLVNLAIVCPDSKVVILDPDDGINKVLAEIGVGIDSLPNLTIIPVSPNWEEVINTYKQVKAALGEQDWLCFDMINRMWDLAQSYYSNFVFGESPIEHLLTLKKERNKVNFGGFDGLTEWSVIKRLHNEQLVDDAVVHSVFSVMATTGLRQILPIEKVPDSGLNSIYAREFKFYPEGEKHNIHRFDTQCYLYRKKDNTYWFRVVRDRGRPVDMAEEHEITGRGFWEVYSEFRGI